MPATMGSSETLDAYIRRRLLPYLERAAQGPLAEATGLRQQQISRFKNGDWKNPPLDTLDKLARAFGLTLAGLVADYPGGDERPAWQQRLYAAVAGISSEEAATPVLWVTGRAQDAPVGTASTERPRAGQKGSTGRATRKRRATA